jgi:hypothetical protein
MMPKSIKNSFLLIFILSTINSMAGCSAVTPVPTTTRTNIPSFALTSTLPPKFTPEPTGLPLPSFGKLPLNGSGDYILKPWSAEDAWNLITADPPEFPEAENGSTYDAQTDWTMVELTLLREIMSRFPNSPIYSDAFALMISPEIYNSLFGEEYTIEPFRRALETAINAEINADADFSPEFLNKIISEVLHQNDIQVFQVLPANNVLKDGTPGWIFDTRINGSYGSAFALSGEPGSYSLVSPRDNWRKFMWSDQQIFTYDLNANGVPEIAIWDSYWGTGMSHFCVEVLNIYEWNGSTFVNLTPNLETNVNTDSGSCLDFETVEGPKGTQAIITGVRIESGCSYDDYWGPGSLIVRRRYEWNGDVFALAHEDVLPLENSFPDGDPNNKCTLSWVNEAGAANDQAFQSLPSLLAATNPDLTAGFSEQFGPAYLDFFNFKLGTWYAMRGQKSQALTLLAQVRDTPANPEFDAASQLAEAFLQDYPSAGAYAGCVAAGDVLDIYAFRNDDLLYLDTSAMREAWGFSDWQWGTGGCAILFSGPSAREDPLNVCSLTTAVRLAVQKQAFSSTEHLLRWLDEQKIPYTGLKEGDVDGDGRRDWLILLGTGQNQSWHLWVLLDKGGFTLPLWITDIQRTTGNIPVAWNTFTPDPTSSPLNVYQWTDGMVIFRTFSQNGGTGVDLIRQSIGYYQGESFLGFTVRPAGDDNAIDKRNTENLWVVVAGENSWEPDWYTLGWDPELNTLQVISSPQFDQDEQVQAAENFLFETSDPQAAIDILMPLLGEENELIDMEMQKYDALPETRPYLQYLLGLAYEMNGDKENAILAYWTLWNDFPIHLLSYIVQHKLESSKP